MADSSMPDWRQAEAYAYTGTLDAAQWAWEFLRRNPGYRSEYRQFIQIWRALEAEYGAPPNRDFPAWKADPRAYVRAGEADGGEGCRVDQDKVLIECALGDKWGFFKFPKDPALAADRLEEPLLWRTRETELPLLGIQDTGYLGSDPARVALGFDLGLPLAEQIERAKLKLAALRNGRRRAGMVVVRTVASLRDDWVRYLRLLDAGAAGVPDAESVAALAASLADCVEARRLRDGGYRDLAKLPAGRAS